VLGSDHPDTRATRKKLATAYQDAGRAAEAVPLLERTSADRKRMLRSDYPGTQTSRKDFVGANQAADRVADTVPPPEQTLVARKSQPSGGTAGQMRPASFKRPPAASAKRALPVGFRRPPAAPARKPLPGGAAGPPVKLTSRSSASRTPEPPHEVGRHDREVTAAITAGDPAGIAEAYDRYAAALYSYCHWILHDSAAAAEALKDTFVIATATLSNLAEPPKLRPWLFALARNECRRRVRPTSAGRPEKAGAASESADVTDELSEADDDLSDATVQFRAVGRPAAAADDLSDATVQFRVIGLPADPVTPFRMISQPTYGPGHVDRDQGQAELQSLIHSILAGLKPREREVIELSFRHEFGDDALATVLGVSQSRAHDLASRARERLEQALGALHIAITGREACPVLGELLADWDGQLTEETRDLVVWHIQECQICAHHGWGAMRPSAFLRLLPLAQLPQELREQVLSLCTSTAEDAVAYRRRVARRAEWVWFVRFSLAIRHLSWSGVRANPGVAIAVAAVAVWIVAAVSVTIITFAGSRAADAQTTGSRAAHTQATQTSAATSSGNPAATTTAPESATARPSPSVTRPSANVPTRVQTVPSRVASTSPAPSRSSSSPRPSKSPTPSRSGSPSPSPSHTASPSVSPSTSPTPA
jgi:RNA polymerase sigma factor (sigma-70 family)